MATALPAATDFTGATVTEGQFKTALTNLRAYLSENMGTLGGGQVDAASGAVFRRNVLVNGNLEIWQRGTGSTSSAAGSRTFLADRWYVNPTGAAVNQSRSTTVRTGALGRYSLEIAGATSVTTCLIGQRIEAAEIPRIARQVTFQAYVYNGSGSAFTPSLLLGTPGSADDFTTVTNRLTQTLQSCADAAWTQVSHTVDISAYTNLANGLQVDLQIPSGSLVSGDTVRVAELQLAAGAVVTAFETEHVSETLSRCQRYYEKSFALATAPASNAGAGTGEARWRMISTGTGQAGSPSIYFRMTKRAAPTVTLYNPAAAGAEARDIPGAVNCSSTAVSTATDSSFTITCLGNAATVQNNAIGIHWTASAEL